MIKIAQIFLFGLIAALLAGCGVAERTVQKSPPPRQSVPQKPDNHQPYSPPPAMIVSKANEAEASLQQAYRDWKGTPYVLGGRSSKGIDCSAFMQRVFRQYFGIKLPRNTKRQLYAGQSVRRGALSTGDLVFFKTGRKTLHVGVIIEGDEFMHASTSQGVTTSNLDDYYWKSRYLAGRRVLRLR